MRSLSNTMLEATTAQNTGLIVLALLTIEHPDLSAPLRIVNNLEDVVSGANTFTAMGFDLELPEDADRGTPRARLRIDNTNQWLTPVIRALSGDFTVTIQLAIPSDLEADPPEFDTIEIEFLPMNLTEVRLNASAVEGTLSYENISNNRFPAGAFTPHDFPGMF